MASDSLDTIVEVSEVARAVACEISAGFNACTMPKWTTAGLDRTPMPFDVTCPSLVGKSVDALEEASVGDIGCFKNYLGTAGATYVNGYLRGAILHSIVVDHLEVADGVYTGRVTIHERSCDYV